MHNNINEKFLTFEFKPDMEMVKLPVYQRNFNTKISLTPTFMKKNLRIFFLKNGSKVKAIYRINGETKTETF